MMAARPPATPAVILFDGVCTLCNAMVAWVIERDRAAKFSFASLQSQTARRLLAQAGAPSTSGAPPTPADAPDSIVLLDEAGVHTRSTAALRIARGLGFPWSLAAAFTIVPRPWRDAVYALIARHRYRWFGKRETCMTPPPALRARFLDADEAIDSQFTPPA